MSEAHELQIPAGGVVLAGDLRLPDMPEGLVVFAHGSGSSRHSSRNRSVADALQAGGLGTLLFDLLTDDEEATDAYDHRLRFDIPLLADRLVEVCSWLVRQEETGGLAIGCFGASTGAAAALIAAAELPELIGAVVSRGGRPDLAAEALPLVAAPTLLIVGGQDPLVQRLNQQAFEQLTCPKRLSVVPGATHLFEEPGALAQVAGLAREWFERELGERRQRA